MKWVCAVTFVLSVAQATALHWPGSGQQPLSFSFPTPEPGPAEHELIEPQTPRISTEATEAMKDTKANLAEEELETAADEATGKLQEALMVAEPPQGPGEEKETRVREKGGFLSNIMQKAAEAFSSSGLTQLYGGEQVRQFQKAVIRALEEKTPPPPMTQEDFDKLMQAEAAPEPAAECPRDYSLQCPETFRFDGATCVALEGYIGPCAKIQRDLPKLTEEQKAAWSTMCQASFPCLLSRCPVGSNYKRPCPVGWHVRADGICHVVSGRPPCDEKIRGDASFEEKAAYEASCHVRWPCIPLRCSKDYSSACPEGWHQSANLVCTPPPTYEGPCKQAVDLRGYAGRSDMKAAFEQRCVASWPCSPSLTTQHRDFDAPCPLSWTLLADGSCEAPPDFHITEDCPRFINSAMPASEKASLALECFVDFPFANRGQCPRDFSSRCPIGWIDLGDGRNCQAPESYIGNCDRVLYFGEMTNSQKLEKMAACAVEWPCVGEWTRGATPIRVQLEKQEILPTYTAQPDGAVSDRGIVQTRLI